MNKTNVSRLQEILQKGGERLPTYDESHGKIDNKFICTCTFTLKNGERIQVRGSGFTKMEAKHDSAQNAFEELTRLKGASVGIKTEPARIGYDAVSKLNQYCQPRSMIPKYSNAEYAPYNEYEKAVYMFQVKCTVRSLEAEGFGRDKKLAKQAAAHEMLTIIKDQPLNSIINDRIPADVADAPSRAPFNAEDIDMFSSLSRNCTNDTVLNGNDHSDLFKGCKTIKFAAYKELAEMFDKLKIPYVVHNSINSNTFPTLEIPEPPKVDYDAVSKLNEFCQRKTLQPKYSLPDYVGYNITTSACVFTVICTVGKLEVLGLGWDKKSSKQASAHNMLQMIKDRPLEGIILLDTTNKNYGQLSAVGPSDEEVIKMFSRVSLTFNPVSNSDNGGTADSRTDKGELFEGRKIIQALTEIEELREAFDNFQVPYVIQTFQKTPLILKLAVTQTDFVVLACANGNETYDTVLAKLLKTAFDMFYVVKDNYCPGKSFEGSCTIIVDEWIQIIFCVGNLKKEQICS